MTENKNKSFTIISISFLISLPHIPQSATTVPEKRSKYWQKFFFLTYHSIQYDKVYGYIYHNVNYMLELMYFKNVKLPFPVVFFTRFFYL